jgi:TRAP-type C4-dicarboxylate transport system permease small subunit
MLERFERVFVRVNRWLIGFMMPLMSILVITNVVGRYCFGISLGTSEEISTFFMIWITYLATGLAMREGRHVAIEMFQDRLPTALSRKVMKRSCLLPHCCYRREPLSWHALLGRLRFSSAQRKEMACV